MAPRQTLNSKPLLLGVVGALLCLLLLAAAYQSLRRAASRLSSDFYFPYLKIASKTGSALAEESLMLRDRKTLASAVERLQKENFDLAAKTAALSELQRENASLRELSAIGRKGEFKPLFAELLSRDPASWNERFVIDKGEDDGVSEGDLVASPAPSPEGDRIVPAAVGRVKSVSKRTAVVCTIASDECKLGVSIPQAGASGLLEGSGMSSGTPAPTLKFLPLKDAYSEGSPVFTSGFSGRSPTSIYIGRLIASPNGSVAYPKDNIFAEARMAPAANIDSLRFVAVFTKAGR